MAKKYISLGQLSIASELLDFVNIKLLPGTGVTKENFWSGLDKYAHEIAPKNKKLLEFRENLQKKIDIWYRDKKGEKIDIKEYSNFLVEIDYLKKEGGKFKIETKNVDSEISTIAGPQLVVPVMNARYALNAANARWGSLYNALYGTDVIPETDGASRGNKYNPKRGEKVIEYTRNFLDENVPLFKGSWKDISGIPKVYNGKLSLKLKDEKQFVGYSGASGELSSLLLKKNNLHIDIIFDPDNKLEVFNPDGNQDKAKVHDIILESAITTIMDHEDSVAAVDAKDKVLGYKNWLGLMKGNLQTEFEKGGKKITRKLNPDRVYTKSEKKGEPDFNEIKLHGRALMLNRNVGHLMTNSSILLKDGSEIPEGLLDAFITVTAAIHDFKRRGNSKTNSVYIVKPKMHGPDEAAFTDLIFEKVEEVLGLKKYTIKIGIMDEERRTTVNLKECIRAVKNRVVFINTGFLDRTGDEIHTSMEAGPMIKKGDMKSSKWIYAYEDNNVDVGLACGFSGIAQIGKGMWAAPDKMADMVVQKINHPKSGANCAWVPSPTAATLHALHYHQVDVFSKQKELKKRTPVKIENILSIPIADRQNWSMEEISKELENNAQGILGYVVRWIDQGVGCSKVPDISNIGLMEDRATLRISSQHIANWLHHGICSKEQVLKTMKKMAKIVDNQNTKDPALKGYPSYQTMSGNYDKSIAFKAACELVFHGRNQPSGYTEPILHLNRLLKKI
uniref:Malate synthase G n=1 Tax=uncultured SAR11 cluster bacterium HF4000_37C10 TaxID=710727 RepID=E0XWJ3_9PROT|nr:malate synthase [uncultured SAR11 cluster bacterium HF4000_37C10]